MGVAWTGGRVGGVLVAWTGGRVGVCWLPGLEEGWGCVGCLDWRRGGVCWLPLYFVAEAQYDAVGLIPAFPGTGGILFY